MLNTSSADLFNQSKSQLEKWLIIADYYTENKQDRYTLCPAEWGTLATMIRNVLTHCINNDDQKLVKLHETWDEMDNAAQRILTALPYQMTEAAERLDTARLLMRKAIFEHKGIIL